MKRYNPKELEPKWQKIWADTDIYKAVDNAAQPKYYALSFFPYPSGVGLHIGHTRNFTITDVTARAKRMQGYNVLHPMGWDSFGLPGENYAIKTGITPQITTKQNTDNFRAQCKKLGLSIDWSREFSSTDPDYYKWTQWFFLLLLERGLAYRQESAQWWCDECKTVLANEQVVNGCCWRHEDKPVSKKILNQWFFKITDYADRLAEDLEDLDWPEGIKLMQRNWIGKSKGAEVNFTVTGSKDTITVFTTRPDTLFGATFMVLAPEHPLVAKITTKEQSKAVDAYVSEVGRKTDIERQEDSAKEKTGVFTGAYAINPVNDEQIPIWIADYVLMGYGTGAIMAVPAHDERDHEFATKFNIPIKTVVAQDFGEPLPNAQPVTGAVCIVYDPKLKKFIGFKSSKGKGLWLAGGGTEGDESFEQTAVRELAEETGFKKFDSVTALGDPVYSYYYNDNKDVNKRSYGQGFLFLVDSKNRGKAATEAHETYADTLDWYTYDELVAGITTLGGGVEHWLEMLRRAKATIDGTYSPECFHDEGILVNSGKYSGMPSSEAREKIVADLEKSGAGKERVNYKIRDWLISRQRYWGAPIPVVHCAKDGIVAVPKDQLPLELPVLEKFQPSGDGRSPLALATDWVNTTCPKCGGPAQRETDTMDGFACSSWYFLRFADAHNDKEPFGRALAKQWLPVDMYVGGAEHAVMHLLYARMWTKVMQDAGLIEFGEPFKALRNQGMLLAADGQKISKSKGNDIKPDEIIDQGYGADALRMIVLFLAPFDMSTPWSNEGLAGVFRFLQRVWTINQKYLESTVKTINAEAEGELYKSAHTAIKKVSKDIEVMGYNTAIAALMQYTNELYTIEKNYGFAARDAWQFALTTLVQLLAPFAPHITEELWADLSHEGSVHVSSWPVHDESYLVQHVIKIAVQVNGKLRGEIEVPHDATQETIEAEAKTHENVASYLSGDIKKVIYIPGKILNFVV